MRNLAFLLCFLYRDLKNIKKLALKLRAGCRIKRAKSLLSSWLIISFFIYTTNIQAQLWSVDGLKIQSIADGLMIQVNELNLDTDEFSISSIRYMCPQSKQLFPVHQCSSGQIEFTYQGIGYNYQLDGWLDIQHGRWHFSLRNKAHTLELEIDSQNQNEFKLRINQMKISEITEIMKESTELDLTQVNAVISAEFSINLDKENLISGDYKVQALNWESKTSEYIVAGADLQGKLQVKQKQDGLDLSINASISNGEALFKDIYVRLDETPMVVESQTHFDNDLMPLNTRTNIKVQEVLSVVLQALNVEKGPYTIDYDITDLSRFYQGFLASYFEIMGVNDLEVEGRLQGQLRTEGEHLSSLSAQFEETYAVIESKKIEVNNLNAHVNWQSSGDWQSSRFQWDALLLAGMPISKSSMELLSVNQQLEIKKGTEIPLFDGSLIINQLQLKDIFQPQIAIQFDAEVRPISLQLITEKMNWPVMQGSIAGTIPGMKKQGSTITFDGSLQINVFDGKMLVKHLSIERLFGIAPVIAADVSFKQLNLQQITSTYDFGEITGVINGYVNELRITNWKVDRLDSYIESTKLKGIAQKISQKAIDNISSIGGIQGALSRSFLRFFDSFRYKKIGLGCKLRNSICEMRGLNTTKNSYYLIEGRGVPSINIIGYRKFIDWEIFLDRLLNANF